MKSHAFCSLFYLTLQREVYSTDGSANTIAHLTGEKLRRYRFAFPPIDEQRDIVYYIDSALKGLNQSVYHIEREISLLREYRTRLIADVVTGKLDVREAVKNLPEETDETEILEDELAEDEENTEENLDSEQQEE